MKVPVGDTRTRIVLPNENIVTDGLVLYLDAGKAESFGGDGTTWRDLSGENNNGTLTNGVGFTEDYGGSLIFDGVDDFTKILNDPAIDFTTNSFTLSCWVKTYQIGTTRMVLSKATGDAISFGSIGYNLYLGNSGTTWLFGVWRGSDNNSVGSTLFAETDKWVHLCGVYNSTQGSQILYANAILSGSATRSTGSISVANNLYVGAGANGTNQRWYGEVAQVSIYNRALSASEVQQNFNALRSRFSI
jgi:hypothetical protein